MLATEWYTLIKFCPVFFAGRQWFIIYTLTHFLTLSSLWVMNFDTISYIVDKML